MNETKTKNLLLNYFLSNELFNDIFNIFPLYFISPNLKSKDKKILDNFIQKVTLKAERLDLDKPKFNELLSEHVNILISGKEKSKLLENFILDYIVSVKKKISEIPNSNQKAFDALEALIKLEFYKENNQVYDAIILLESEFSPNLISKIVCFWKEEALYYKEHHKSSYPEGDIFWVSRDFMENIDGISRYRFREFFNIGEFEPVFTTVESMLASSLLEGSSGFEALAASFWGDTKLTSIAHDLWFISRSNNITNRIRDFVNIALRRISYSQFPEGCWSDFQVSEQAGINSETRLEYSRYLPCTYTTALCSLNLLKLAISEPFKQKGVLGAKWLLNKQNQDGSWSQRHIKNNEFVYEPDVFLTLLALEVISRSGIENVEHTINLGIDYIKKQQNELGMWEDNGFPFPFMTVLVLEFLMSNPQYIKQLDSYLSMSKDFLNRSIQFSLEDNSNSHRLAVITAFQGIEAFLYSILSQPNVNIKIFEKANETIGMRKALTKFQEYLQNKGIIKRNEVVSFRNSLDSLAYIRDQVVHKGISVNRQTCRPLVNDALKFAIKYSYEIYGYNIWS